MSGWGGVARAGLGGVALALAGGTPALALGIGEDPGDRFSALVFIAFVAASLAITVWSARHVKSAKDFYAAGGRFGPTKNGVAISGEFISAGTLMGITGLAFLGGADLFYFSAGATLGLAILVLLFVERLRLLGRYTFADAVAHRLERRPARLIASLGVLTFSLPFLIAQLVASGALIGAMFDMDYIYAVMAVGVLMTVYVFVGGMIAATWIQLIKAVLLIGGGLMLAALTLIAFDFDLGRMATEAAARHRLGEDLLAPGGLYTDPISIFSLTVTACFGVAGYPHILMGVFRVPTLRQARISGAIAVLTTGVFMALVLLIGLGAIILVSGDARFLDAEGALIGGSNMAAMHLARALGGPALFGFLSGVAFATILAVVAGVVLAVASTVSHDLFAEALRGGHVDERTEIRVSQAATLVIGATSVGLAALFENENVSILTTIAASIAASVNFPILFLALYWRGFTTAGVIGAGVVGLCSSAILVVLGPTVWTGALGHDEPVFPYAYPTLFTSPAALIAGVAASLFDRTARAARERAAFDAPLPKHAAAPPRPGFVGAPAQPVRSAPPLSTESP